MTREEAKKSLPIIQAFAEGKKIEMYYHSDKEWKDVFNPLFNLCCEYRVKPEPKYRPFKDADECWNEMLKHQPFGWVKGAFGEYATIDFVNECGTARHGSAAWDFKKSFDDVVFADGTPFGIKEGGDE